MKIIINHRQNHSGIPVVKKKNTQRKIIPSSADGSKKLNNKYFLKGN